MLVCSKYSQTFDYVLLGNLPLRGSFFIMFYRLVCSFVTNLFICVFQRFAGFGTRFGAGFDQAFWFAYLPTILVCWLSDAFVTRFSYLWQTKGHTLIHSWTYLLKAPLRYALVVCLHFIPPNHEQMKKFYRQIRNILAVVRYRYRDLEERERKRKGYRYILFSWVL